MKKFNNIEEMQPYFNDRTKTYEFIENGKLLDIEISFDLSIDNDITTGNIKAFNINAGNIDALNINAGKINALNIIAGDIDALHIDACNIEACDINAWNINACNIEAGDIKAWDITALDTIEACDIKALNINAGAISFFAVCFANQNIICKSINGKRTNSRYFALDGEVIIKED